MTVRIANRLIFTAIGACVVALAACSSTSGNDATTGNDAAAADAAALDASENQSDGGTSLDAASTTDAGVTVDAGDAVARLLALTATCTQVSNGLYSLNAGDSPTVPICGLSNAVFWKADMDIDCDGKQTTQCNSGTDPDYQNQTAASDSKGNALDAANLPYVVIPGKSTR
ncbi:MAG: glycoside hydrolase family 75 protein, partial [Polyangiaceae bacterium]